MDIQELAKGYEQKYGGGEAFFTAMDEALCCNDVFEQLYRMVEAPGRLTFILTGKFGREFQQFLTTRPHAGYMVFPGGMRDGVCKAPDMYRVPDLGYDWTERCVFVDDSFFSGATRATCLQMLYVKKDLKTIVAYDGSHVRQPWVRSLYRYHPEEGPVND